jgi:hypothetical protein
MWQRAETFFVRHHVQTSSGPHSAFYLSPGLNQTERKANNLLSRSECVDLPHRLLYSSVAQCLDTGASLHYDAITQNNAKADIQIHRPTLRCKGTYMMTKEEYIGTE